jgi:hypothetical protein
MHLKAAEIDSARHDHMLDGVGRTRIAGDGVFAGKKTHSEVLILARCHSGTGWFGPEMTAFRQS